MECIVRPGNVGSHLKSDKQKANFRIEMIGAGALDWRVCLPDAEGTTAKRHHPREAANIVTRAQGLKAPHPNPLRSFKHSLVPKEREQISR